MRPVPFAPILRKEMSEETGQTADEKKGREAAEEASALDKLTDRVEEKELDANKVRRAMDDIAASQKAERAAQKQRDRELAAVKIRQEDVVLIATEFETDRRTAERRLREHQGNVLQALESFL